ncbi:MAG: hypothetical protein ACYTFH_02335 [Planctomycetota bacterium]|jgi:hypothetical protein
MRRLALTRLARAGRLSEIPDTVRASIERGPIATTEGTVVPTVLLEEATAAAEGPAGSAGRSTAWLASLDPSKRAAGVRRRRCTTSQPCVGIPTSAASRPSPPRPSPSTTRPACLHRSRTAGSSCTGSRTAARVSIRTC